MSEVADLTSAGAMARYIAMHRPRVCPRCGDWDGPDLPTCRTPGWTHDTACVVVRYANDVCRACEDAMAEEDA